MSQIELCISPKTCSSVSSISVNGATTDPSEAGAKTTEVHVPFLSLRTPSSLANPAGSTSKCILSLTDRSYHLHCCAGPSLWVSSASVPAPDTAHSAGRPSPRPHSLKPFWPPYCSLSLFLSQGLCAHCSLCREPSPHIVPCLHPSLPGSAQTSPPQRYRLPRLPTQVRLHHYLPMLLLVGILPDGLLPVCLPLD